MDLAAAQRIVTGGGELEPEQSERVFGDVLDGAFDPEQLARLLSAMSARGETSDEILGAARALRKRMTVFEHDHPRAIDTCGTGGDGSGSFNISTAAAIVAAAAGAKVVKHGNRSQSSRCGSADVLEAAGMPLDLSPAASRAVLDGVGITFLYAPAYHPVLAGVSAVRRSLKRRTVFNWLGPVCNPGDVRAQMIGSATEPGLDLLAVVLIDLDEDPDAAPLRRALIVHSSDGADELTLSGTNHVCAVNMDAYELDAASLGLAPASAAALAGGDATVNLALLRRVLDAEPSALYDAVRLNATAALLVDQHTRPDAALAAVTEALRSGRARDLFARWIDTSRSMRGRA